MTVSRASNPKQRKTRLAAPTPSPDRATVHRVEEQPAGRHRDDVDEVVATFERPM